MSEHISEQQFTEWYEQYGDAIFRHCYFRVRGDRERAMELMQESFVRTWKYAQKEEIKNVRAFLYRTATNLIINEAQRKKATSSLDSLKEEQGFDPESAGHEQTSLQNIEVERILETLERLSPEYREVIIMRYIDELEPHEIADVKRESANAVSIRLNRAIKKARELLSYESK